MQILQDRRSGGAKRMTTLIGATDFGAPASVRMAENGCEYPEYFSANEVTVRAVFSNSSNGSVQSDKAHSTIERCHDRAVSAQKAVQLNLP
jgi:hypothetical protein